MGQLLRAICNTEDKKEQVEIMRRLWRLNVSDDVEKVLVTNEIISKVKALEQKTGDLQVRAKLLLSKWEAVTLSREIETSRSEVEPTRIENQVNCDKCGNKYSNAANLKRHKKTMHEEDETVVENTENMENEIETRDKPSRIENRVECGECGNKYSNAANLKRHKKTMHEKRKSERETETGTEEPREKRRRPGTFI